MPRTKGAREKMKELSAKLPPAKVVAAIQEEEGGSENISSISKTARNTEQIHNLKRHVPNAHRSRSGPSKQTDFTNMFRLCQHGGFCKSFELKDDRPRAFLATDQQIRDLESNCTGTDSAVLQIDVTFSLGNFYLTTTAYRSKQFENGKTRKTPSSLGPI